MESITAKESLIVKQYPRYSIIYLPSLPSAHRWMVWNEQDEIIWTGASFLAARTTYQELAALAEQNNYSTIQH